MAEDQASSTVMLARPAEGETARVSMQADCVYRLGFEPGDPTWSNDGKDVLVHFDNGSNLVLQGFLPAAEDGSLYLEMPDGAVVLGKDLVDSLARSLEDFRPSGGWALLEEGHGEAGLFFALAKGAPETGPPEAGGNVSLSAFFAPHDTAGPPPLDDLLDPAPPLFPDHTPHPPDGPPPHSAPSFVSGTPHHAAGETLPAHPSGFADSAASLEDCPDNQLLAHLFLLSL